MTLVVEARAPPLPEYNHTATPNLDKPEPRRRFPLTEILPQETHIYRVRP